jgi:hypothetical protein
MARRMDRSGSLIFFYGPSGAPATAERESGPQRRLGVWLALIVFVMGMLFFAPHVLG